MKIVTLLLAIQICCAMALAQRQRPQRPPVAKQPASQKAPEPKTPEPKAPEPPPQPEIITPPETKLSLEEMKRLRAVMETSMGNIVLEFYPDVAPEHVRQFVWLARAGYFDGMSISRILPRFIIQSGNFASWEESNPNQKKRFEIPKLKAEYSPSARHDRGALSMARPNGEPDGGTCHFFICAARAPSLDDQYSVFGYVIEGMEVVDQIAAQPVEGDKPVNRIEVKRISIVEKPEN